jgi:Helicase C-terminal domain
VPGTVDYAQVLRELGSDDFKKLRPAQEFVLGRYAAEHTTTADLAVELPTGAGKSLIALLICEAWRREGSTVAVLTGNKVLARQMEDEGRKLGVPVVRFEGEGNAIPLTARRAYRRGQAIAVMNYWVMFNQNPVVDGADLLVVDDAHLAEAALDSLYSIEIDRFDHPALFGSLVADLAAAYPDYASLQDALTDAPTRTGTELLSFLDQAAFADRLRAKIDAADELRTDSDLRFRWSRVRERLMEVNIYCSTRSLWLRPYVYPLGDNERYSYPQQRIYMSATIGDPADLSRRLGTRPITKLAVDPSEVAQTFGRRLLVLNPADDQDIPPRLVKVIVAALKIQPKSVWLCASKADAEYYRGAVAALLEQVGIPGPCWQLSARGDEIERFKSAPAGHLFVAGRFDGMDFNADQCRLVVLATQPRAINPQEAFASDYLRDASFMMQRLNQRIIQALGRCNRGEDDYGVYVLADRRFAAHFGQEARRRGLPPNIQAEIDLAENATELPEGQLIGHVTEFLNRDFTWFDRELADANAALPAARAGTAAADTSEDEVAGWLELHGRQDYRAAEGHFRARQEACRERELGAFAQWCEAKAAFLEGRRGDSAARTRALQTLEHAIGRGGASAWFNRQRGSLLRHRQAAAAVPVISAADFAAAVIHSFDELLERLGTQDKFERWRGRLTAGLAATTHDQYAESLQTFGELLAYSATRPKYGAATDCRWRGVFGNYREGVTWEAKIEHENRDAVCATDVGQAHNQLTRAQTELGGGYAVRGTIVTHMAELDPPAAASIGTIKVIRKDAVAVLWARVDTLLGIYAGEWSAENPEARLLAADRLAPCLPPTGWLTRALDQPGAFIGTDGLLAEWPAFSGRGDGTP